MIKRTVKQIASMLNAEALNLDQNENAAIEGVEIDSRNIKQNQLFIPLIGARSDGHEYIDSVIEKGAAASLWQKDHTPYPENFPLVLVDDTEKALQELARVYIKQTGAKVAAITGSNGKTSAKDMARSVFGQKYKTYSTPGNRNNQIGMPLTILELDDDTEIAVLEMGMENFDEINFLCSIARPDISIITSIGSAHMENLGDKNGIARAKLEIYENTSPDGLFLYNAKSPELAKELKKIRAHEGTEVVGFLNGMDVDLVSTPYIEDGRLHFKTTLMDEELSIPSAGLFQAENALPIIYAAKWLNIENEQIRKGLAEMEMTKMRSDLKKVDQAWILDDTYKSNPESAMAAIDTLMEIPSTKHVAVLSDMLDLGPDEIALHEEVGRYAKKKGAGMLYAWGPLSRHTAKAFGSQGYWFENKSDLIDNVRKMTDESCAILVKGSRAMKMDEVVAALGKE